MDKVQLEYMDAYKKYNGKPIKITKHTEVRYYIQGDRKPYAANQVVGFTQNLLSRLT